MKKIYNAPSMKVATLNVTELVCDSPYAQNIDLGDDVDGSLAGSMGSRENTNIWDDEW